jgi:ribosomal protein S18 acetylase RimI-like enzyme
MPRVSDLDLVQGMLERDRPWSAYALGDLSPGFSQYCDWFADERRNALLLLFHGFETPIAFGLGAPADLAPLFDDIDAPRIALHIRSEAVSALAPRFAAVDVKPMWRLALDTRRFTPLDVGDVEPIGSEHVEDVARLYADGVESGETPDFFFPSMLEQGTFRGIRVGGELVSAAGTHLFAPDLGVCAVGNVYTRRDARGRGYAARVTSAVVADVLARGVQTIVLNVRHANDGANRIYERLGFRRYCEFVEGIAERIR